MWPSNQFEFETPGLSCLFKLYRIKCKKYLQNPLRPYLRFQGPHCWTLVYALCCLFVSQKLFFRCFQKSETEKNVIKANAFDRHKAIIIIVYFCCCCCCCCSPQNSNSQQQQNVFQTDRNINNSNTNNNKGIF